MDPYAEFSALRVALQERQTSEAEIARLLLARIDLLDRYNQGGRHKSIYARRLDENGWQKDRAQQALLTTNNKIRTLLMNEE